MLVLTRKFQQQIQIGDNITITILRIKGNAVRVGIDAPRGVKVIRSELPKHPTEAEVDTTLDEESIDVVMSALGTALAQGSLEHESREQASHEQTSEPQTVAASSFAKPMASRNDARKDNGHRQSMPKKTSESSQVTSFRIPRGQLRGSSLIESPIVPPLSAILSARMSNRSLS